MEYLEMVKAIAHTDFPVIERGEQIIRQYGRVIDSIFDYKYAYEHYHGDNKDVILDKANSIKNALGVLLSEIDIYTESLGISDGVRRSATKRTEKIYNRLNNEGRIK